MASELLACVSLELLEHFVVDLLNVPAMPSFGQVCATEKNRRKNACH